MFIYIGGGGVNVTFIHLSSYFIRHHVIMEAIKVHSIPQTVKVYQARALLVVYINGGLKTGLRGPAFHPQSLGLITESSGAVLMCVIAAVIISRPRRSAAALRY